jgi:O-succinylbenzoic acid--CoA ligase
MDVSVTLPASGNVVSASEIANDCFPAYLTGYERETLLFCKDWLNGKESFILQTSGSTGSPKPITVLRIQMITSARMTGQALQLASGDPALVNLHIRYIAGRMMLVRGLELKLPLTVTEPSASPLALFASETVFKLLSFVPAQLQTILEQTPEKLSILNKAKAILLGGAPITTAQETQLQRIEAPVFQTYGMTETLSHIALRRLNGATASEVYTVLPGVHIETDQRGCLVIQTPVVKEQSIVTNDIVQILSPATFRWVGRIDNVINSGGVKVQAERVEQEVASVLTQVQLNRRFFVAGIPHTQWGEVVALFMEGTPVADDQKIRLLEMLEQAGLSRYELPKEIFFMNTFLETPTGKVDKKLIVKELLEIKNEE